MDILRRSSVFNVLNRDGYNITKHEFEGAFKKLDACSRITYQAVQCSLIDIPIGTLDLLTKSPALDPSSEGADLVLGIEALSEDSAAESSTIEEIRCPMECETQSNGANWIGKPSASHQPVHTSVLGMPILLIQAWQRARSSNWFLSFPGSLFRF
jgi:hypothetical protein